MKLHELDNPSRVANISKVFESQYGVPFNAEKLSTNSARALLKKVRKTLGEQRSLTSFYTSQNNPSYLKLVIMEQALEQHIDEDEGLPIDMNDPKLKQTMDKAKRGSQLSPEEQKTMTAVALAQGVKKESSHRQKRMVKEGEMQEAQVVLAAQDFVDRIQDMIEDVSSMQYKDLPALVDTIRADIGADQAAAFNTASINGLTSLLDCLQTSKVDLEAAQSTLTGDDVIIPGAEDVAPDVDAEVDALDIDAEEIDVDVDTDGDVADMDDTETVDVDIDIDDVQDVGRERR
jgi:hypothetical protein